MVFCNPVLPVLLPTHTGPSPADHEGLLRWHDNLRSLCHDSDISAAVDLRASFMETLSTITNTNRHNVALALIV